LHQYNITIMQINNIFMNYFIIFFQKLLSFIILIKHINVILKKEFSIINADCNKNKFELHDSVYKILNGDFMVKISKIIIYDCHNR